jgi:hypothetical protein
LRTHSLGQILHIIPLAVSSWNIAILLYKDGSSDDISEKTDRQGIHIKPADKASDFFRKSRLLKS